MSVKLTLPCLAAWLLAVVPAAADDFLPVGREQILDFFRPAEFLGRTLSGENMPADIRPLLQAGDTVWLFHNTALQTRIAMAGQGDQVHSLRIVVGVVNNSQEKNDQVLSSLSALFSVIYPSWSGASRWPAESLDSAWSASAKAMEKRTSPGGPFSDALISTKVVGGVTASTFGVPPDLAVYAVTVRADCVPEMNSSPDGNPFQRIVC